MKCPSSLLAALAAAGCCVAMPVVAQTPPPSTSQDMREPLPPAPETMPADPTTPTPSGSATTSALPTPDDPATSGSSADSTATDPMTSEPSSADPTASEAPQTAPGTVAQVDDAKIEQFADAYVAVQGIQQKANNDLQTATDPAKANEVQTNAQSEMIAAVERSGLQVEEFNQIVSAMAMDENFRSRVAAAVQKRTGAEATTGE